VKKPLGFIYRASFTVYLSHCLFLQIITSAIGALGVTDIGVQLVLRAAMCYTAPFIMWYVWYLIKKAATKLLQKRKEA
jgi:peptidoglycan/LPS O-acetylase OafA/YrhL